jgi:serine protease AprX
VDGTITQVRYTLPNIPDIQGNPQQADIEAALKSRLMDTYADGNFYPNQSVTREDLARTLALDTPMRQLITAAPKFADVSGDLLRITEAITANGSTLRDYNFVPGGMMSADGPSPITARS